MKSNNFMGQILHPVVVENAIKGLFDGDKYVFNVHIEGRTQVYYILVELTENGLEKWSFVRDNTTYRPSYMDASYGTPKPDMFIKGMSKDSQINGNEFEYVPEDVNIAAYMAEYVMIYMDALETVDR